MGVTSQRKITTYEQEAPSCEELSRLAQKLSERIYSVLGAAQTRIQETRTNLPSPAAERMMELAAAQFPAAHISLRDADAAMESADTQDGLKAALEAVRAALASGLPAHHLPHARTWADMSAGVVDFAAAQNALDGARYALRHAAALDAREALRAGAASGRIARTINKFATILGKERDPLAEIAAGLSPDEARAACERLRCEAAYAQAHLYGSFCPNVPDGAEVDHKALWKITRHLEDTYNFLTEFVAPAASDSSAAWDKIATDGLGRPLMPKEKNTSMLADVVALRRRSESTASDGETSASRSRTIRHSD